ncbi:MAG: GntR family transcriptional regulator [Planctomycetes bacterium]|nr:GntR family transcriptional regulator [Planctomycetota bacterium]
MAEARTKTPRISLLAEKLVEDIDARELKPGDRYLTTTEASKLLGVGNGTANRTLQLLERRRLIVRQQRRGAYIADPPHDQSKPTLHRVHFLVHQKYLRTEGVGQDEVLLGLEHELPGVPVQISFLPSSNEAGFVAELIDESLHAKRIDGFVLVRASYETQRLLADRQIPSVVHGTVYPSIERLASLTADMESVGKELANYLLEQGHTTFAYLNRQLTYGGDQRTIDGISAALHAAGKGLNALTLRFLPTFDEVYFAEADRLFSQKTRPTGFICRTVRMAEAVQKAGELKGLVFGKDFDIGICDYYLKPGQQPQYPWARSQFSSEEQGRHLARLLIGQVLDAQSVGHETMPVKLELPLSSD